VAGDRAQLQHQLRHATALDVQQPARDLVGALAPEALGEEQRAERLGASPLGAA